MAVVWALLADSTLSAADKLATLYDLDKVLGFELEQLQRKSVEISAEIQEILLQREAARKAKDWALSDSLRKKAAQLGFSIEDSAQGQKVTLWKNTA